MCRKTKLLTERDCRICNNPHHFLFFRNLESKLVYFFAKCTKCNHSFRSNMTMSEWQKAIEQNESLQKMTKHHRIPKSKNGTDDASNISYVPEKKHQAWHILFANKSPERIVQLLNEVWLPPNIKLTISKPNPITPKTENNEYFTRVGNQ